MIFPADAAPVLVLVVLLSLAATCRQQQRAGQHRQRGQDGKGSATASHIDSFLTFWVGGMHPKAGAAGA